MIEGERIGTPSSTAMTIPCSSGATKDVLALTAITIMPSGLTRGVTSRITPTSTNSISWVMLSPFVVVPAIRGTEAPTMTRPCRFSIVMMCGRFRTRKHCLSCNARIRMLIDSLAADKTSPPYPNSLLPETAPKPRLDSTVRPAFPDLSHFGSGKLRRRR